MTKPDLRETILAHLRAAGAPIASRELASRFLLIRHGDEATCHRLLAPFLAGHPSLEYTRGEGWSYRRGGSLAPGASAGSPSGAKASAAAGAVSPTDRAGAGDGAGTGDGDPSPHPQSAPDRDRFAAPLRDFVALAAEGAGPSGSGRIRVVSLQPVVAGEECSPEHLPAWAAEDDVQSADMAPAPCAGSAARAQVVGLEATELQILVETIGDLPIVCHRVAREAAPLLRACAAASLPFHPITISLLAKLGHLLLGLKGRHAPSELAAALGLEMSEPDDCRGRVRLMTLCFLALLPMLDEIGITSFDDLQTFQNQPSAPLDFSPYAFTLDDLKAVPARPGVYRFYDRSGETLYIGKAKNLRSRLSSYFVPSARNTERGRAVLERVHSFSFEIVASELEALLNEAALLSELRPPLNRQFDVHQRPAPYGPRLNLAVVLPEGTPSAEAPPNACTVHLMHEGRYQQRICGVPSPQGVPAPQDDPSPQDLPSLQQEDAGAPRNRWNLLDDAVRAVYFQSRGDDDPGRTPAAGGDNTPGRDARAGDVDWQLVASYLARYRDEVNVLDVDECDSLETALARLRVLAVATVGGERVVAR
jgi:hypothetical protein